MDCVLTFHKNSATALSHCTKSNPLGEIKSYAIDFYILLFWREVCFCINRDANKIITALIDSALL